MLTATLDVSREQILKEDCPTCGAPASVTCTSRYLPSGGMHEPLVFAHPMRRWAAQKTLAKETRVAEANAILEDYRRQHPALAALWDTQVTP